MPSKIILSGLNEDTFSVKTFCFYPVKATGVSNDHLSLSSTKIIGGFSTICSEECDAMRSSVPMSKKDDSYVTIIDPETGYIVVSLIADSFTEFLEKLYPCQA